MDIRENIASIPSADSYQLQMRYKIANTNDSFNVYVQDSGDTWTQRGSSLTSSSWATWTYDLQASEVVSGTVRVKFVDANSSSTAQDNLLIDYLRVKSTYTPTNNYQLNWEHRISGVSTAHGSYTLRVLGYRETVDAEDIGVYVRNFSTSSWESIGNLPTTTPGWLTKPIAGGSIGNYLSGGAMSIRYFEDTADSTQSKIHIDYVVLEGSGPGTGTIHPR